MNPQTRLITSTQTWPTCSCGEQLAHTLAFEITGLLVHSVFCRLSLPIKKRLKTLLLISKAILE
ncbi:unnamed protein product, partial [Nesidiocoris tenuis]